MLHGDFTYQRYVQHHWQCAYMLLLAHFLTRLLITCPFRSSKCICTLLINDMQLLHSLPHLDCDLPLLVKSWQASAFSVPPSQLEQFVRNKLKLAIQHFTTHIYHNTFNISHTYIYIYGRYVHIGISTFLLHIDFFCSSELLLQSDPHGCLHPLLSSCTCLKGVAGLSNLLKFMFKLRTIYSNAS